MSMTSEVKGKLAYFADVRNSSQRPIRDVASRIKPLAVQGYDWEADQNLHLARIAERDW